MLDLILGAAGTGKTTLLYQRIEAAINSGDKVILIVPEQYSFESEKALYRRLGPQKALSVEVLSFTRLCNRIFREFGGLAGVYMDNTAKYLLMSVALDELSGHLQSYHKNISTAAFIEEMCSMISELKSSGVDCDKLREIAEEQGSAFREKLSDIALIYDTYQAMIQRGYADPDDDLIRAYKLLEEHPFFQGYQVFIDGFMAFMGSEFKLLSRILMQSPKVTAAFTCDGLADKSGHTGMFSAACATANRLVECAKKCGGKVLAPTILTRPKRYHNPAIAHLSIQLPKLSHSMFPQEADGISLLACTDIYDELEYIASQICTLVREEGYRYRDIVLISRSLERYLVPLQTVFSRYEIPFFADLRQDVQIYPLVSGLMSALESIRSNFDTEQVLSLGKKCITGIDPVKMGNLENYVYIWQIKGSSWTQQFTNNPAGMSEKFGEEEQKLLKEINLTRIQLIEPLVALKKKVSRCDGKSFALAVFRYLEEINAVENLQNSAQEMPPSESKAFLETGAQIWDLLMDMLDVFGGALSGVYLPLSKLIDLLRLSLVSCDIGLLPQTLDQVIVGTADRIRPNEPKAVFVLGLNEGEFPRWSSASGLLSSVEREELRKQGVELLNTPEQTALYEKYYVYFALSAPSDKLFLTYPQQDTAGVSLAKSSVIDQVKECLPIEQTFSSQIPMLEKAQNKKTAFDIMTRHFGEDSVQEKALKYYFYHQERERFLHLSSSNAGKRFVLEDKSVIKDLFGETMRLSPSKVERFYNCPFSYFCQVGLRLNKRKKVEFNPLQSGSLVHLVLQKIVSKYGGKGLAEVTSNQLRAEITELIDHYLRERIKDYDTMSSRFKYLFHRLVNTLLRLLSQLSREFAQSSFEPAAFELPIGLGEEIKPMILETAQGNRVIVEGIVDRMDVMEKGGKKFIRVVDYKSGSKLFKLSDIFYGLNMQMLIYLFSIWENGENNLPAGVLYMPAKDNIISAGRDASDEEIINEQTKRLRMNGLILDDMDVLSGMEKNIAGIFIPAKLKKDGTLDAHSSIASLHEMTKIKKLVETLLTGIGEELYQGHIQDIPCDGPGYSPCQWCDYKSVCTHEETDPVRELHELDKKEILQWEEAGERHHG